MTDCICWYSQGLCTAHPSNAPRPTPPEPARTGCTWCRQWEATHPGRKCHLHEDAPRPTPPEPDEAERADLARLRAQLAEAREVIRSVEWAALVQGRDACPDCYQVRPDDHAPDCRLAAVLENS